MFISPFFLPCGKVDDTPWPTARLLRRLCYQGLAVDDYGFAHDAADMGHPRLSLN